MDHLPLENLGNDIRVEQVTSTPRDALNRELAWLRRSPAISAQQSWPKRAVFPDVIEAVLTPFGFNLAKGAAL